MISQHYIDYKDLVPSLQKWIEENNVRPYKIVSLCIFRQLDIYENDEEVKNFLKSLVVPTCGDIIFENDDYAFEVYDEQEEFSELEYQRDGYIEFLKGEAPSEFYDYINFEKMATDIYADLTDVFDGDYEFMRITINNSPDYAYDCNHQYIFVIDREC